MPSIPSEDSGEIASSLYALGIVHPTGYPLFSLLGHAWLDLPLGGRVIVRLNLLMALLVAAAVFLFYRLFVTLLRDAFPDPVASAPSAPYANGARGTPSADATRRIAAAGGALALAFSRVVWTNAGSLEVYALHLLFLPLVTLLFVKSMPRASIGAIGTSSGRNSDRIWILFAYTLGLSFTNHMMTVLLAPGYLFLFFAAHGLGAKAWSRIARAIPPFLLGLTPYLYLPIRSAAAPLPRWIDASSWSNFYWHVSGSQYHHKMFTSVDVAIRKGGEFLRELPSDLGYAPLALAIIGLIGLAALGARARRALVFTLLLFLVASVYEANYDFPDPNFRLNAHFITAFWAAAGIFVAARFLAARSADARFRVAAILAVAAGAAPLSTNFSELNRHDDYAVEDYARNVLMSTDTGSVLLTNEEWTVLFPALYLQRVEGFRTDVAILHPAAILNRWNEEYIQQTTPWVFDAAPEEFQALELISNKLNGTMNTGDAAMYRGTWAQVAKGLLNKNLRQRPVFVTFLQFFNASDFGNMGQEYPALPVGMTFRLFPDAFPTVPLPLREPRFHTISAGNKLGVSLGNMYPDVYYNRGVYEVGFLHDTAAAVRSFLKAQELKPGHANSQAWLVKLGVRK